MSGDAVDGALKRILLRFEAADERELIPGAVEVVTGALRLEVDIPLNEVGQEAQPDLEGDEATGEGEFGDLGRAEEGAGAAFVAERTRSPKS